MLFSKNDLTNEKKQLFTSLQRDIMKERFLSTSLCVVLFMMVSVASGVEEGRLTVTTDPDGIEIWLGDNFIGNSPVTDKKVPVGRYMLKLIDPVQRISQEEQVMITSSTPVIIEKKMKPKFGTIKVTSIPEDADVYFMMPLGKTPLTNEFINPGKYVMEVRPANKKFHPSISDIVVTAGSTRLVADTLVREKILSNKAVLRLALGAGAVAGFVWAIIEQGEYQKFTDRHSTDPADRNAVSKSQSAGLYRNLGIIGGSLCVIGFEIVAFF